MIYRKPYTSSQNGLSHTLKRKFSPIVGRLEKISSQNLPSNRERQYNLGLALFYHKEIKICLVGFRKSFNHRFSVSKDLSLFHPIEALIRNLPHPGQILVESTDIQAYLCPHIVYSYFEKGCRKKCT